MVKIFCPYGRSIEVTQEFMNYTKKMGWDEWRYEDYVISVLRARKYVGLA